MIKEFCIKNFKGHSQTLLHLSSINILTGMNGLGKSSVLQALLLLRQTQSRGLLNQGLELNGELCSIGVAGDAIYKYSVASDDIEFTIRTNDEKFAWSFRVNASNIASTFVKAIAASASDILSLPIFNENFQYISAYRTGPVESYEKDTSSVELLNQISRREGRCELVAHYFDFYKDYLVDSELVRDGSTGNTVKDQVEEWMRVISSNIYIEVKQRDTDFSINYSYSRGAGNIKTENLRATNIGFGISYVLPIVLAIIVSCSKDPSTKSSFPAPEKLIIIENPEAHIHPSAQAGLMELVCRAARKGVQFLIETHSDHIINGLLVEVKKGSLSHQETKVFYFERDEANHSTISHDLEIQSGGKIKNPRPGFFDQIDIHMKQLLGF